MGKRGPIQKPEWMTVLSGTDRPDRPRGTPDSPGDAVLTEIPAAPNWLPNDEAREEWARVAALLLERGQLDPVRLGPLGMYCATHGKIQQMFKGGVMPSAHLMNQYRGFARDLGISDNTTKQQPTAQPAKSRWQQLKERASGRPAD